MMNASNLLLNYWQFWLIGAVAVILTYVFGRKTEPGRKILDWLKINVPVIGSMSRKVTLSRSVRTLGTMVASAEANHGEQNSRSHSVERPGRIAKVNGLFQ